jgi:hypothetical protein
MKTACDQGLAAQKLARRAQRRIKRKVVRLGRGMMRRVIAHDDKFEEIGDRVNKPRPR